MERSFKRRRVGAGPGGRDGREAIVVTVVVVHSGAKGVCKARARSKGETVFQLFACPLPEGSRCRFSEPETSQTSDAGAATRSWRRCGLMTMTCCLRAVGASARPLKTFGAAGWASSPAAPYTRAKRRARKVTARATAATAAAAPTPAPTLLLLLPPPPPPPPSPPTELPGPAGEGAAGSGGATAAAAAPAMPIASGALPAAEAAAAMLTTACVAKAAKPAEAPPPAAGCRSAATPASAPAGEEAGTCTTNATVTPAEPADACCCKRRRRWRRAPPRL